MDNGSARARPRTSSSSIAASLSLAGTSNDAHQRAVRATPLLTCERCRERKIRCDKLEPCTSCAAAGVICVPIRRLRLPRGRHVTPSSSSSAAAVAAATAAVDDDLRRRIRKLESIIDRMAALREGGPTTQPEWPTVAANAVPSLPVQGPDDFWMYLADEIHGLREVLEPAAEEVDDENETVPEPQSTAESEAAVAADQSLRLLNLSGMISTPPGGETDNGVIDRVLAVQLCEVYLRQVDPVIKILHRPSIRRWIVDGQPYLDAYPSSGSSGHHHPSTVALRSALCYFAAISMTERQCEAELLRPRTALVAHCRQTCEAALERSGLLTTRDTIVLQAFVLYLFARKTEDRSRAVWTLVALAVRIARALRLDREPSSGSVAPDAESFFDQQMRRRLWVTICLLDLQASHGQATQPLITRDEAMASIVLPAHIDDADFGPGLPAPNVVEKEGITDTTFAHVTYRIQLLGRGLIYSPNSNNSKNNNSNAPFLCVEKMTVTEKVRLFEQQVLGMLHFCDPESSPFTWFTWHGTQCLVFAARLMAIRPVLSLSQMRRTCSPEEASTPTPGPGTASASASASPPTSSASASMSPETVAQSLRLATQSLEKTLLILTDPRGEGFRWYIAILWMSLAIAISDCYVCTDVALVRRAWSVIEALYQRYEAQVTQNSGGKLRGPLGKLMQTTRERVAPMLVDGLDTSAFPTNLPSSTVPPPLPSSSASVSTMAAPFLLGNTQHMATSSMVDPAVSFASPPWTANPQTFSSSAGFTDNMADNSAGSGFLDGSMPPWDDLMSDMPFDDLSNSGVFFIP